MGDTFGQTECLEEENVESNTIVDIEFTAKCMRHTKISIVNIWVESCEEPGEPTFLVEGDDAEIPECCHPPPRECKTVQYTFKLPCIPPCPDDSIMPIEDDMPNNDVKPKPKPIVRKLSGSSSSSYDSNVGRSRRQRSNFASHIKKRDGSTAEFESVTAKHHDEKQPPPGSTDNNNNDDDEDDGHFCVIEDYPCGPNNDKVHVCHYSARDGYKTFCVPEPDSDALRFYPKDYCGPCVGGYAHAV